MIDLNVSSRQINIDKLNVVSVAQEECKSRKQADRYLRVDMPDGRFKTTDRFWNSLCSNLGQSKAVFNLFSHKEVFDRIMSTGKKGSLRLTINYDDFEDVDGNITQGELLAVSNPKKPILPVDDVNQLIDKYEGYSESYNDGVISVMFDCPFETQYMVKNEAYKNRFMIEMPIDGYGVPTSYLVMLRMLCSNGIVGMDKAFKTSFQLGKKDDNLFNILDRAIESFNSEEGFHAFHSRMESASESWASLNECRTLLNAIEKAVKRLPLNEKSAILKKYMELCGDPLDTYGLGSPEEISNRRSKVIPVNASIYSLITYASELTTHHVEASDAVNINAWIGSTIANEYDLEGTMNDFDDLDSFFLDKSDENG